MSKQHFQDTSCKIVSCQECDYRQYGHKRVKSGYEDSLVHMYSCIYEISFLLSMLFISVCLKWGNKHTRPGKLDLLFRISHLLNLWQSLFIIRCTIYVQHIYGAIAIKCGHVTAWKAIWIVTVEAADLKSSGC